MTDEELGEYLEKELAIDTADNFLDSLHAKKSQSRR